MEDQESGARKRRRTSQNAGESAEDGKKQRGRPRVEGADETAADRRRTQIRLAQRAYRQRKETTIKSLNEQVKTLRTTVERMNQAFLHFNDKAIESGVLQVRPELGHLLKATTEQFIHLTKAAGENDDEQCDSDLEQNTSTGTKRSTPISEHNRHWIDLSVRSPSSEGRGNATSNAAVLPLGYVQVMDESSDSGMTTASGSGLGPNAPSNIVHIALSSSASTSNVTRTPWRSKSDTAISAHSLAQTQQSIAQDGTPPDTDRMLAWTPQRTSTLSPQITYSFQEPTFARRLLRASIERGFRLLLQAHLCPAAFARVFRLSLLYNTREQLLERFRGALTSSTARPREVYNTPFIHLGGAGLHYKKSRVRNGYIVKQGPIMRRARLEPADGSDVGWDIDLDLREYEGEWFDVSDVEGYLEEKGFILETQSSFAELQMNARSIPLIAYEMSGVEPPSPYSPMSISDAEPDENSGQASIAATNLNNSLEIPFLSEQSLQLGANRLFPELAALESTSTSTNENAAAAWLLGSGDKTPDFLNSGWADFEGPSSWNTNETMTGFEGWNLNELPRPMTDIAGSPKKRTVVIDVGKMIEELIKHGICLGRAPGFRKRDVDSALQSAIIQVL